MNAYQWGFVYSVGFAFVCYTAGSAFSNQTLIPSEHPLLETSKAKQGIKRPSLKQIKVDEINLVEETHFDITKNKDHEESLGILMGAEEELIDNLSETPISVVRVEVLQSSEIDSQEVKLNMAPTVNSVVRPIVICGPSGSGKSTLLKRLFAEFPENFGFSVSHTTRKPRTGEENGVHYHFVTREEILEQISLNQFIEHAEFSGNIYGTSFNAISAVIANNKNVILDIDSQGVDLLKKAVSPANSAEAKLSLPVKPLYIFLAPPSLDELEKRLRGRGTESEESLQLRLDTAKKEMTWGVETAGNVDVIIVNDDLEVSYQKLKDAIFELN
ncbi:hypothetical protein HK096_003649 [Nowakowskiella sp. JEL0078]|nr:hypothetical protein HK096_003649 [Nowakowskiella sp. JEL0078]